MHAIALQENRIRRISSIPRRAVHRLRDFLFPAFSGLKAQRLESILSEGLHPEELQLVFADWSKDIGAGTFWDLSSIVAITRSRRPRLIFEIGTGKGRSALHLALNTPDEVEINTLDISEGPIAGSILTDHPLGKRVRRFIGDSKSFDFSPWQHKVDLVLIDGAHDFKSVQRDTLTAFELVSPTGVILWDDFNPSWPGVVRALKTSPKSHLIRRIPGTKLAFYNASSAL